MVALNRLPRPDGHALSRRDITRGVAVASAGSFSVAANARPGKTLKSYLIPGFLSQCIASAVPRARRSPAAATRLNAVVAAGSGYLLCRGVVTKSETKGGPRIRRD